MFTPSMTGKKDIKAEMLKDVPTLRPDQQPLSFKQLTVNLIKK